MKHKKTGLSSLLCLIIVYCHFLLIPAMADNSITVEDMVGRPVTVASYPHRIVCLAPGTLRLLVYLQAHDRLVGIEDYEKRFPKTRPYFIANPHLANLPSIGPGGPHSVNKHPDYEKILAAKPELIFVSYMEAGLADQIQKRIGVPVFIISYGPSGNITEQFFDSLAAMGNILGKKDRAQAITDYIRGIRQSLRDRVRKVPETQKPSVYIGGLANWGIHGIESTETSFTPFEWTAARNVVASTKQTGHLFIEKERLLMLNPDIIFLDGSGSAVVWQDMKKKPGFYQGLKAFQNKTVYTLHPYIWYLTNVGTVINDAFAVGKQLYPDQFKDIELAEQADRVYQFLVGAPIYAELVAQHGPLVQVWSPVK